MDELKQISYTCQVCRQPFRCAVIYPQVMKLSLDRQEWVICGDCRRSFRQWFRTREELGLELKEKSR